MSPERTRVLLAEERGVDTVPGKHPKEGRSFASSSKDSRVGELIPGTGQSLARPTRLAVSVPVTVTQGLIFSLSLLDETLMEGLPSGSSGPSCGGVGRGGGPLAPLSIHLSSLQGVEPGPFLGATGTLHGRSNFLVARAFFQTWRWDVR